MSLTSHSASRLYSNSVPEGTGMLATSTLTQRRHRLFKEGSGEKRDVRLSFTPTTSEIFPFTQTHERSYLVSMAMKKSPSHSVAGGGRKRFGDVWKEFEWGFAIKNGFMEVVLLKVFPSRLRRKKANMCELLVPSMISKADRTWKVNCLVASDIFSGWNWCARDALAATTTPDDIRRCAVTRFG